MAYGKQGGGMQVQFMAWPVPVPTMPIMATPMPSLLFRSWGNHGTSYLCTIDQPRRDPCHVWTSCCLSCAAVGAHVPLQQLLIPALPQLRLAHTAPHIPTHHGDELGHRLDQIAAGKEGKHATQHSAHTQAPLPTHVCPGSLMLFCCLHSALTCWPLLLCSMKTQALAAVPLRVACEPTPQRTMPCCLLWPP